MGNAIDTASRKLGRYTVKFAEDHIFSYEKQALLNFVSDEKREVGDSGTAKVIELTIEKPEGGAALGITVRGVRDNTSEVCFLAGIVMSIVPESPCALAGIQVGDRLLSIGGTDIVQNHEATDMLTEAPPGPIAVVVLRKPPAMRLIRAEPAEPDHLAEPVSPPASRGSPATPRRGRFSIRRLPTKSPAIPQ